MPLGHVRSILDYPPALPPSLSGPENKPFDNVSVSGSDIPDPQSHPQRSLPAQRSLDKWGFGGNRPTNQDTGGFNHRMSPSV